MNIWGERFADVRIFIGYCRDLGVETDQYELEHYERIGAMLPIARVVYPDEYVIQRDQSQWNGVMDWNGTDQWPALGRLSERVGSFPIGYQGLTDEELIHCIDREMEAGNNPHLIRSESAEFRPWSDYEVAVHDSQGIAIKRSTVEHYYSYWQVHQLFWIQKYPDLYKNARLIERIPEDDPVRMVRPFAPKNGRLVDFDDKRRNFDALSFWVTVYGRERSRTFAGIAEMNGVRRLDVIQAAAHRTRLATLAWEDLLMLTTGDTRDKLAEELGKASIYDKRTFRHLDLATKERDYALDLLNGASKDCATALGHLGNSQWSFTDADANDLLNYCEQTGLGLFMTALSGMVAIVDEEYRRNFRRVQKYTNLKNVLNSYEYFLKSLTQGAGLATGGETLTPLVRKVLGQGKLYGLFRTREKQKLHMSTSTQQFLTNLNTLMGDTQLNGSVDGYWAQQFLITCLARNMTVHSYPSEDSYYGDLFGPMLDAAIIATFYTWRYAKTNGWV